MYAGAQVAPDSERPTTSRLYELIVGAQTAASARVRQQSSEELVTHGRKPKPALVVVVVEQVLATLIAHRDVEVRARARAVRERLGHEARDGTVLARDLRGGHLEQHEVVGRLQRVGVGEVDLELAVPVLVIDLVDVDADGSQRFGQFLEDCGAARKTLVVVTRLVERVRVVERRDPPALLAPQQHELGLHASPKRQALGFESLELVLEGDACAVGIRLAPDVPVAGDTCVARHPGQRRQRRVIADAHVIGTVRPHAHSPDGKARKAGTVAQHHVVMLDRN
jgi:hypothetical protein